MLDFYLELRQSVNWNWMAREESCSVSVNIVKNSEKQNYRLLIAADCNLILQLIAILF